AARTGAPLRPMTRSKPAPAAAHAAGMHGPSSVTTPRGRPRRNRSAPPIATAAADRIAPETFMYKEPKSTNRYSDTPRDKPQAERVEHGNLERPGAQAHPKAAATWNRLDAAALWRLR